MCVSVEGCGYVGDVMREGGTNKNVAAASTLLDPPAADGRAMEEIKARCE